jgi:dipeptidyl aminopeptidase/acylaminoacyl peptidase
MSNTLRHALGLLIVAYGIGGCAPKTPPAAEDLPAPETEAPAAQATPAEPSEPVTGPALGEPTEAAPAKEPAADEPPAETTSKKPPADPQGIAVGEPHPQAPPASVAGIELIPREILFGNPDKTQARISPDGTKLSYLAPVDGVLNVFVGPVDDPDAAKPVTDDKYRGIRAYFWAFGSGHILYIQDKGGDEDWHVYRVDLATEETKDLTPIDKVNAQIQQVSDKFPDELLIGLNDRDPRYHDIYRVNIGSGELELVQQNPDFASFVTDDDYQVRFASKYLPDGGMQLYEPDGEGGWKEFEKIPFEDTLTTGTIGFDKSGKILYMTDSRDRDTAALAEINLENDEEKILAQNDKADVGSVLVHPTEKNLQAVSFNYEQIEWDVLDEAIQEDIDYLRSAAEGELQVASRTLDDSKWIVAYLKDDGPTAYYLYDRPAKKATLLFTSRKALEGLPLAKMHPVVVKSRDGLEMVNYLTLPKASDPDNTGRPSEPLPMVLLVHGGPWGRDTWGYDAQHQWLANRGYAVLSVNYRGSTGFGKNFTNAGNKQWAAKMHDDLIDAVEWAKEQKIADPEKIAIMGGSYGGYATLVGLTFTPEVFNCGVDIVGPSNLQTLLSTIPPYWAPAMELFKNRVGDPTSEEGQALLKERSPLTYVDKIQKPLLIGQGANDPRVKQAEADQIVGAMQAKKIPVTYVLFPDEGHGFARPSNRLAFYAVAEAFLAEQSGGRYEPIGKAFAGSTITCPEGASQVPGLAEAMASHQQQKPDEPPAQDAAAPGAE